MAALLSVSLLTACANGNAAVIPTTREVPGSTVNPPSTQPGTPGNTTPTEGSGNETPANPAGHDSESKFAPEPQEQVPTTGYFVMVDVSQQRTYVYKDGALEKEFSCSTGIETPEFRTPRGNYIINESGQKRGEWFFSNTYQEGAKYWVGFIGGEFLFHSLAMDKNQQVIPEEAAKLGTPASHGCIRLAVEDAHWFYSTIPNGTPLLIQD
jgi:lipoprotein-anchoring transpeptidase ErfK/SrfK